MWTWESVCAALINTSPPCPRREPGSEMAAGGPLGGTSPTCPPAHCSTQNQFFFLNPCSSTQLGKIMNTTVGAADMNCILCISQVGVQFWQERSCCWCKDCFFCFVLFCFFFSPPGPSALYRMIKAADTVWYETILTCVWSLNSAFSFQHWEVWQLDSTRYVSGLAPLLCGSTTLHGPGVTFIAMF